MCHLNDSGSRTPVGVTLTDETPVPEEPTTAQTEPHLNREEVQDPDTAEAAGGADETQPDPAGSVPPEPEIQETTTAGGQPAEILETTIARSQPVVALEQLTPPKHKQRFQNRALKYIFWLIIFVTVITMATSIGVTLLPDGEVRNTVAALASDIAKSAIPTLIALLGTATAWAFSQDSEKDQ
jgi:hypothetical protein